MRYRIVVTALVAMLLPSQGSACMSAWADTLRRAAAKEVAWCLSMQAECRPRLPDSYYRERYPLAVSAVGVEMASRGGYCTILLNSALERPFSSIWNEGECREAAERGAQQVQAALYAMVGSGCNICPQDGWYETWNAAFSRERPPESLSRCFPPRFVE